MYVGNLKQWRQELPYLPETVRPWIERLASFDLAALAPGRHDLGGGHYMNVDEGYTEPAPQRKMEAHRSYIDIQTVVEGAECIGYQPVCQIGPVVEDKSENDAWFYDPDQRNDTRISMQPGTVAIFTPADGHRCLCAPDGKSAPIRKVIMKIRI